MSNPNTEPANSEITVCPELRDKIFEHLPSQAKKAAMGAEAKFWPNVEGEMTLWLRYDARESILDIETEEIIYGPDGKLTGSLEKGCELDSVTGEVHAYSETMDAPGRMLPIDVGIVAAENDAVAFNNARLDFLLGLFDKL